MENKRHKDSPFKGNPMKNAKVDASGLIDKAIRVSKKFGHSVDPVKLIQREFDSVGVLRRLISEELKRRSTEDGSCPLEGKRELPPEETAHIIKTLFERSQMEQYKDLCPELDYSRAESALRENPTALWSINEMERNGHSPVIYFYNSEGFKVGTDLTQESPMSTRWCSGTELDAQVRSEMDNLEVKGIAEREARNMGLDIMTTDEGTHFAHYTPDFFEDGSRWYKAVP